MLPHFPHIVRLARHENIQARQMGASELFTRQSDGDLQSVSPMRMELVGDRSGVIGL